MLTIGYTDYKTRLSATDKMELKSFHGSVKFIGASQLWLATVQRETKETVSCEGRKYRCKIQVSRPTFCPRKL